MAVQGHIDGKVSPPPDDGTDLEGSQNLPQVWSPELLATDSKSRGQEKSYQFDTA